MKLPLIQFDFANGCILMLLFDVNVKNTPKLFWKKKIYFCQGVYGLLSITGSRDSFICKKISHVKEQNMNVQVTYRNPMFCTNVLHKRHRHFSGAHSRNSRIFFLNNVGDTIFINPSVKCPIFLVPSQIQFLSDT